MKPAVLLSNNYFLALAFIFGWTVDETCSCDTKWIRLVYMMSCGKKKRESVWSQNDTFYENLPSDFDGAFKYFKERDPFNPMLHDALLYEILEDDKSDSLTRPQIPKLLIFNGEREERFQRREFLSTTTDEALKMDSILIKKLFSQTANGNHLGRNHSVRDDCPDNLVFFFTKAFDKILGIQGFPEQWYIEEIIDEKINENHRREIDRLIEECCKIPPVTSCNGNTFSGACK